VLSEFAGAADELHAALLVNPHDIDGLKRALRRAMAMSDEEAEGRMRSLRDRVIGHDVNRWAQEFLAALRAT